MASLNKVILIGNAGQDPELRYTSGGKAVTSFSLATAEKVKNKVGEWEEKTEWHRITLWGKLAEIAGEFLSKGKSVYIEGRLQSREYEKDGIKRYITEIIGDKILLLSRKGEKGNSSDTGGEAGHYSPPGPDDDPPF